MKILWKNCTRRIFNAKTSHYLSRVKWRRALIRWSIWTYLTLVFQEASLQNHKLKKRRKENYIFHHLLMENTKSKDVTASWFTMGPLERFLDIILLVNNSHNHVIKKDKYTINVFLSLCYWVLKFFNFMCMAMLLKESKDNVSFVMFFFQTTWKSLVITSVWRMPNKHSHMYHKCISVFTEFSQLIYLHYFVSSSPCHTSFPYKNWYLLLSKTTTYYNNN